jgi:hypothetical protein
MMVVNSAVFLFFFSPHSAMFPDITNTIPSKGWGGGFFIFSTDITTGFCLLLAAILTCCFFGVFFCQQS